MVNAALLAAKVGATPASCLLLFTDIYEHVTVHYPPIYLIVLR